MLLIGFIAFAFALQVELISANVIITVSDEDDTVLDKLSDGRLLPIMTRKAQIFDDDTNYLNMSSLDFRGMGERATFHHLSSYEREPFQEFLGRTGGKVWRGALLGQQIGFATIIQSPSGSLTGSFSVGSFVFKIQTLADGSTVIERSTFSDLREETGALYESSWSDFLPNFLKTRGPTAHDFDEPVSIDHMVVVTRLAVCYEAGVGASCDPDEDDNMVPIYQALLVAEAQTNAALEHANVVVNLVEVVLDRSGYEGNANSATMDELQGQNDGALDYVHELRDVYAADLVSLIVEGSGCALGEYLGPFSVVRRNCLSQYSLTHELGHNFGCLHDRQSSFLGHRYAHGFQSEEAGFSTVMAYGCQNDACPRVPFFSNKEESIHSERMGNALANNIRRIAETAPMVAQWR